MTTIPLERIEAYRARTYRTRSDLRISTKEEAIAHVDERGFVMFWPIKDIVMPSLWAAVVGDRPVPNTHDDPGHVTWGWKDSLLGKRQWYYSKLLRRKATMVSLELAPTFYALTENFGSPEEDYLYQYQDGAMTLEAKTIYEALLRDGPMHALALRRASSMTDSKSTYRFNRGLAELQMDMKVMPIGVAEAGAWNYAFIYECVHRYHPEFLEQARSIKISEAQQTLIQRYFGSVGAATLADTAKVFWWEKHDVQAAVQSLAAAGVLVEDVAVKDGAEDWIALSALATDACGPTQSPAGS
jgi:hypothetical protein